MSYPLQVAVLVPGQSQQKQPSNTGTVSARFIGASGTNTLTPSRKRTVTVCSVVGTLYTDFKNGTVLFTVELRTTDRLSPSLHRLSSASSVKEPLYTVKNEEFLELLELAIHSLVIVTNSCGEFK